MIKLLRLNIIPIVFLLAACAEPKDQSLLLSSDTNNTNSTYSSAVFNPATQYKTHQVAAFVVPTNQASLSFQVSGIIDKQFIKIGDKVEKGQTLFKISNPSLEPQIHQFSGQIDAINATLEQNKNEVQRFKNLKATNAVSQNELDRLTNQNDNLLANKKSLEAQLEQAKSLYEESFLKAPFAGNIAEIYKEAGEVISPGEAILVVGGVNSLEAPIFLPSFLHQDLQHNQNLTVTYKQHNITASIKEISLTANPASQLFKVMLNIPIMHQIKSGEKITVQIQENIGHYFRLPIESVIDDGINQPFVFLIVDNEVTQTPIDLIEIINEEVIVNMQHEHEVEVITAGQAKLSPQQKLTSL